MNEKPILFSSAMIRAILEGRKTQTRRVIKAQPPDYPGCWQLSSDTGMVYRGRMLARWESDVAMWTTYCPYGQPGDRLWVRETWATDYLHDGIKPSKLTPRDSDIYYRADDDIDTSTDVMVHKWRPSIFMPRWASRINLTILNIRVERVQDISHEDAVAEGCPLDWHLHETVHPVFENGLCVRKGRIGAVAWFWKLWDSINAKRGYSWKVNPWVWVIEFEK